MTLVSPDNAYGPLLDTTMRVMSWNIWFRFGPWERRQPAIIETLRRADADVVALQEVWAGDDVRQIDLLAAELGMHAAYDSRMIRHDFRFGNAVLSRWPIAGTQTLAYVTDGDSQESRLALRADIDGPRGAFQMFCTHLNWRLYDSALRQSQVRQLTEFVAGSRPRTYPAIVCGDFNADPASDEVRMMTGRAAVPADKVVFADAWEIAGVGDGFTWDNSNPHAAAALEMDRRIDYVFTGWRRAGGAGHALDCRLAGNEMIDGVWPSDHFAVVAELRY
jgi:endonuclease/exonuclease/phosphatase family metal-dependent hydrolase